MRRNIFRHALARWGFTTCAFVALATEQTVPFLVAGAIALYAWKNAR